MLPPNVLQTATNPGMRMQVREMNDGLLIAHILPNRQSPCTVSWISYSSGVSLHPDNELSVAGSHPRLPSSDSSLLQATASYTNHNKIPVHSSEELTCAWFLGTQPTSANNHVLNHNGPALPLVSLPAMLGRQVSILTAFQCVLEIRAKVLMLSQQLFLPTEPSPCPQLNY